MIKTSPWDAHDAQRKSVAEVTDSASALESDKSDSIMSYRNILHN